MLAITLHHLSTALRIAIVSTIFIAPVAGFTANHTAGKNAGVQGAGFILFMSLQRNR